jgi:hypothetical protein
MRSRFFFSIAACACLVATPCRAVDAIVLYQAFAGYAGCKEKSDMLRVLELTDQSDVAAAMEMIRRGIKSKDCSVLVDGDLVIESSSPFSRLVKVHTRGDPDAYWIIQ